MAKIGISEFHFGFAYLFEQATDHFDDLLTAPILPSLRQEAEEGWDAHLPLRGLDCYYQFKMSEYMKHSASKHFRDGFYESPYHQFHLHPADEYNQHRKLKLLSSSRPETYYVAPEFICEKDFNEAFLKRRLSRKSCVIPLTECDDIVDCDIPHHITYQMGSETFIQWSEPKKGQSFTGTSIRSGLKKKMPRAKRIDHRFIADLYDEITEISTGLLSDEDSDGKRAMGHLVEKQTAPKNADEMLRDTAELLAVHFGVVLVIVGEGERETRDTDTVSGG